MSIATTWGATPDELADAYPCDALMPGGCLALWRGIDIAAPPALVFRWLCQLRVAPYSYDWIDNFGRRSPRELTPGLDELAVGQTVMRMFEIVSFDAPSPGAPAAVTVVNSARTPRIFRSFGDLAVTYRVTPDGNGSRLVAKVCAAPRGPFAPLVRLLLPWGDWIMMRKQFHTLRRLAERDARRPLDDAPHRRAP